MAVGELVEQDFIPVYQQVGQFVSRTSVTSFQNRQRDRVAKQGGNVVTYFCTPNQHVLGWVVGPVSSDNLIAEAQHALKSQQVLHRWSRSDVETQREQIREHSLSQIHSVNRQHMKLWTNFKTEQRSVDDETVARTVALAKRTRDRTLGMFSAETSRLIKAGRYRNPEVRAKSTRIRNAIRSDMSRMVIAELPLIELDQVQRSVFETLANQSFEPRSQRNEELLKIIKDSIARKKPTILALADNLDDESNNAALKNLLKEFTVLRLTLKELTRLSDDLDHSPVESSAGSLNIVVLNAQGERTGVIE